MNEAYQTVTLVLSDGRRVTYTGRAQIDPAEPPIKVVDIIGSQARPLQDGMTFDTLSDGRCLEHPGGERCALPAGHEGGHKWTNGD